MAGKITKRVRKAIPFIEKRRVKKYIVRNGKRFTFQESALWSKSYRDFIMDDLRKRGYETCFTFTKLLGYQIYKRKKR